MQQLVLHHIGAVWSHTGHKILVQHAPERAVIIDISNYYPHRDGNIAALDDG